MPVSQQDHGRITMAISVVLGCLDKTVNLRSRQVLPGPKLRIRTTTLRFHGDCSQNGAWGHQLQVRFHWAFPLIWVLIVRIMTLLRTV